jgi:hypothetical protein
VEHIVGQLAQDGSNDLDFDFDTLPEFDFVPET